MKTINAQLWKLGAVSLAFVLAITMMISSSPVTTVEAAACTMDITEIATPTTGDAYGCGNGLEPNINIYRLKFHII